MTAKYSCTTKSHDGDTTTQPQPKTAVSPGLYDTKEVVDKYVLLETRHI